MLRLHGRLISAEILSLCTFTPFLKPIHHAYFFAVSTISETLVDAPFDDTRADVILRSSDGVDFRVFRIILSLASPIFADMFSIPQPAAREFHAGPQVVTLSEDSKALDLVLRHLYPMEHPTEIELRDACILIEFARKYEVKAIGLWFTFSYGRH